MTMTPRYAFVDVARGIAFCAMFIYHAAYFAQARGLVDLGLGHDIGWRLFQKVIAGTFYFLVGVSLFLANRNAIRWGGWLLREGKLIGCAVVVTLASYVLDPNSLVTYGILHNIAVCSAVGLLLLRTGPLNLLLAAVCFALPALVSSPVFDAAWLRWTGLGTFWPRTFDHQPFLPWMGVVCLGLWAAERLVRSETAAKVHYRGLGWSALSLAGRHSLLLYMAHVPVLVLSVEIAAFISAALVGVQIGNG